MACGNDAVNMLRVRGCGHERGSTFLNDPELAMPLGSSRSHNRMAGRISWDSAVEVYVDIVVCWVNIQS